MQNNPIRYTDPTGHWEVESPDGDPCTYVACLPSEPDLPSRDKEVSKKNGDNKGGCVPPPGQWICDFDGITDSSHYYELSNIVCLASWHCTQEEMIYYLSLFAYPGQDPSNGPAIPTELYSVSPPFGWFPEDSYPYSLGLIQVSTRDGGLISINTTMKSHIFCCGTVERSLSQDASGAWIVTTVGSGSNSNFLTGTANVVLGPGLFEYADTQMLNYIMEQKFP